MNRSVYVGLTALAALMCIVWLFAAFHVAGIWFNCIPNSTEYPCPTTASAWKQTVATVALTAMLTSLAFSSAQQLKRSR